MKKMYYVVLMFCLFTHVRILAQAPFWDYDLQVFNQPFEQITYDTLGDYDESWELWDPEGDWLLDLGFTFEVMDIAVDQFEFWDGDLVFQQPYDKLFVTFGFGLQDRGLFVNGNIPMRATHLLAHVEGEPGNRVFILGLDNAGILGGDSLEFINFQVRLYEADNALELHYGPCYVRPETYQELNWNGPYIEFADYAYANGVEGEEYLFSLNGDPEDPIITNNVDDQTGLIGTPPEGTVYRFVPLTVSTNEVLQRPVSVWFTGAALRVVSKDLPLYDSYALSDLQGRVLLRGDLPEGDAQHYELALPSSLGSGMYLLSLHSQWGVSTRKVWVQR